MRSNPPGAGLGLAEGKRGRARAQGGRFQTEADHTNRRDSWWALAASQTTREPTQVMN